MSIFHDAAAHAKHMRPDGMMEPRERFLFQGHSFAVEELPEGGYAIVCRFDEPYVRHDYPITEEVMNKMGAAMLRRQLVLPAAVRL